MDNLEWLHKHMRSHFSGAPGNADTPRLAGTEGVSEFPRHQFAPANKRGRTAMVLVDQAADLVRSIEDHANDIETRARSLAEDAIKRLQASEKEIQRLEEKQVAAEAYIGEIRAKLHETGEALARERERVRAAEELLPQLETRARTAEARAEECENALARIECAIRVKILKEGPPAQRRASAA